MRRGGHRSGIPARIVLAMVRIGFRSALWLSIVLAWLTLAVALAVLWSVVAPGKTPRIQAAPRIKGRRGI